MNPNIYLAYMVFLGLEQESGSARELAESFKAARRHGLFKKMSWSSEFERKILRVASERTMRARMDFIYEGHMAWSKVNAKSFMEFLKKYGFKE